MPFGELQGLGSRTAVFPGESCLHVPSGDGVLGRVLNGLGEFCDGREVPPEIGYRPVNQPQPQVVDRPPIQKALPLGVRALDALLTCAEGGRLGLFAAAGVGKSVLLSMVARHAEVDAVVLCLVGERGREVKELLETVRSPSVVCVVSTASDPTLARARAPLVAQTIAESLRDSGRHVLLLMDSLTRYVQALREIGMARGEAPAARGFPPSALAGLAPLIERSGPGNEGAITALYTVLVEGNDPNEPVADAARSFLDGHIELSRRQARAGIYPAVDPSRSISRLQEKVIDAETYHRAQKFRALWSSYEEARDLISVGAYTPGGDPQLDAAVLARPAMERFIRQRPEEFISLAEATQSLQELLLEGTV